MSMLLWQPSVICYVDLYFSVLNIFHSHAILKMFDYIGIYMELVVSFAIKTSENKPEEIEEYY